MDSRLVVALLAAVAAGTGSLPAGEIRFREVSGPWGIDFRHHHGGSGELYMAETMGSGVVVFDYDGDGDQDVFLVDSGELPGYEGETPRSRLYRNDGPAGSAGGAVRFVDVTAGSGIEVDSYGMGATAGDVDGDGDLDLYVTAFGPDRLFRNRGDGTFEDATAGAGLGAPEFGSSAAFADVDRDGDLDLYVANYVDFTLEDNVKCGKVELGIRAYCHPDAYEGVPDRFYRNRGDGTFEDATADAGFAEARGKGLGVIFGDVDVDGWPDLYVANDMTPNLLYRNLGGDRFEEVALLAGAALDPTGDPEAGMGVELGDLDGDQLPELMTTHIDRQSNALYGYAGSWLFVDKRFVARLAEPSFHEVGFGLAFADLEHDGDLDVAVANGHILHNVELFKDTTTYAQRNQVFRNLGDGRFVEVEGAGLDVVRSSRGLAAGDLDGDGDLDLVINNSNDGAEVYENVSAGAGAWLQVDLRRAGGEPFGVGARLAVRAGGRALGWREVRAGSSYQSQHALTAHFGLGAAAHAERLTVRWPDGTTRVLRELPADRRYRLDREAPERAAPPSP